MIYDDIKWYTIVLYEIMRYSELHNYILRFSSENNIVLGYSELYWDILRHNDKFNFTL